METAVENKTRKVFTRITPSLDERLEEAAKDSKREKSEVIRMAMQQYVDLKDRLGDNFDPTIRLLLGTPER